MTYLHASAHYGMTLREACVLVVGILGCPTGTEVHAFLVRDGWPVSQYSVKGTLNLLRGSALEVAEQGRSGFGRPSRYRQSEAARAWVMGVTEGSLCRA